MRRIWVVEWKYEDRGWIAVDGTYCATRREARDEAREKREYWCFDEFRVRSYAALGAKG